MQPLWKGLEVITMTLAGLRSGLYTIRQEWRNAFAGC